MQSNRWTGTVDRQAEQQLDRYNGQAGREIDGHVQYRYRWTGLVDR